MTTHGKPLQAAIRRLDTSTATNVGRVGRQDNIKKAANRHTELWTFYDQIPEVHFWVNTMSGISRQVHYFPAVIADDTDITDPEPDPDPQVADLWVQLGGENKMRDLVAEATAHRRVAGEAFLVAVDENGRLINPTDTDLTFDEAHWEIVSAIELRRLAGGEYGSGDLDPDLPIWRLWKRHFADGERADPPLASVTRQCHSLIALDGRVLADARSRLSAGVHLFPASLQNAPTPDGKSFDQMLDDMLLEPIRNPDSVDAIVPAIAYIQPDEIEAHKAITFGRSNITDDIAQRTELVRRIAAGLDAPAELLLGMGDLNHWSAWLITDTTYTQHADPDILAVLNDLSVWWRNGLEAAGIDPTGRLLWRDPTPALRRSDPLADTIAAYDRYEAGGDALRRAAGLDDTDIPTVDEIERRIEIARAASGLSLLSGGDRPAELPESANPADGDTPPEQTEPPPPPASRPAGRIAVIVAANGSPIDVDSLARDLTQLDRELLAEVIEEADTQINVAADAAIRRVLAEADQRGFTADTFDALTPDQISDLAGPDGGVDPDDFDGSAFADLLTEAEIGRLETLENAGISAATVDTEDDVDSAVALILSALIGAAIAAVTRSRVDPDNPGEASPSPRAVPLDAVRDALTVAGGTPNIAAKIPDADLIANGARTIDDLARAGLVTVAYEWIYGDLPRNTFRPHLRMDGRRFTDFDDPTLEPPSEAAWLGSRMYPGDHKGCRCTYRRVIELATPATPGTAA